MKKYIENLKKEKEALEKRLDTVNTAIHSVQRICPHESTDGESTMECYFDGPHKKYYRCSICGFEESY